MKDLGKIKLPTRQILLYLIDGLIKIHEPFDRHGLYRKYIHEYYSWRDLDKKKFRDDMKRLQRQGLIDLYLKDNVGMVELTGKGQEKLKIILAQDYKYITPKNWDKKWRIVIFDIPDTKKKNRELFRNKLKEIGFLKIQESVYVYPFDSKETIDYFKYLLNIGPFVQYIVAETIESQTNILDYFLKNKTISKISLLKSSSV